jgi:hypothetical protein
MLTTHARSDAAYLALVVVAASVVFLLAGALVPWLVEAFAQAAEMLEAIR